jgi:hypothetical protein
MTITSLSAVALPTSSLLPRTAAAATPASANVATSTTSVALPVPSVIVTLSGATTAQSPAIYTAQAFTPPPVWQDASIAITTASGRPLTLTLQDDGSFNIKAQGEAPLSDAENAAIAKLSAAFRSALEGMASTPPRLDLGGLAQVDTSVLSSVHLSAKATDSNQAIQTIDFTADVKSRGVKIAGQDGKLDVSVDLSSPAITGSKTRQAAAISNYLTQFEQAASRGHANPLLMTMFEDAFTQMNAPSGFDTASTTRSSSWLNDTDHALLSGLADFSASITQTATSSNPRRADEHDGFSFQVSQTTQMSGRNASERGMSQTSSSQLHASFHSALSASARLNLTDDLKSQNYYYSQINDSAQSIMSIGYQKGRLVQATLSRTASQSTERLKYVMGQKVEDVTTPLKTSQQRDLLPVLQQMERHPPQTTKERDERTRALDRIHDSLGLLTDPVALR